MPLMHINKLIVSCEKDYCLPNRNSYSDPALELHVCIYCIAGKLGGRILSKFTLFKVQKVILSQPNLHRIFPQPVHQSSPISSSHVARCITCESSHALRVMAHDTNVFF